MQVTIVLGTTTLQKVREVVEWLEKSPLELNPLDLAASIDIKGTKVEIKAPRVSTR